MAGNGPTGLARVRAAECLARSTSGTVGALLFLLAGGEAVVCGIRFGYNRSVERRDLVEPNQAGMEGNPKMIAQ